MSIDVTDKEIEEIAKRLSEDDYFGARQAIERVIYHLNCIRSADPIGTVRRSPSGATQAMKTGRKGDWLSTYPTEKSFNYWRTDDQVKDWTIVYSPEAGK